MLLAFIFDSHERFNPQGQKASSGFWKEGDDYVVVGFPKEGLVMVPLPKVLVKSTVPEMLKHMMDVSNKMRAAAESMLMNPSDLTKIVLGYRLTKERIPRFTIFNKVGRRRSKKQGESQREHLKRGQEP